MSKKNAPKKSETTVSKVVESPSESESRSVSEGNSIASGGGFFSRWRQRASLRLKGPVCRLRLKKTAAGAVALSAIGVLGYFGYGFYADYVSVPTVEGANFSLEYRKIPFDVPSVDFIYSTDLDAASIIPANVTVSPAVAGSPALSKSNVVSFVLSEKLKVGSKYVFTLSKEIASKSGKKASKDTIVELEAVGGVAVSRAIPTGETENLSKNPIFIFNIPIVALATLAEKDKLPCPLKFEPALPGRCSWIAGNVLEYVLEKPMTPATKYQVVLSSSSGFLYPMKEEFKTEFSTFRLKAVSDNAVFSPRNGINLSFNADVSKTELEKKLSLKDSASGAPIPAKVDAVGGADVSNSFVITGKDGPLPHSKKYAVSVSAGLLSVGANLPLEKNADFVYESANFIRNVEVKYKIFSETGALLDTPGIYSDGTKDMISVIPAKNGILTIDFDEDVDFVKDSVYLAESGGKKIADCELSSFERQVDLPPVSGEPDAANKASYTSLKCEPKTDLPYGEFVNLIVTPAASKSLRDIAFKAFAVSKEFKVSDFKLLSPTEACLYSTTTLESNAEGLVIEPKAVVRDFSPDGTYEWRDGRNSMRYACPVLEGKKAYVAWVRLNPNTAYSFVMKKGVRDTQGNALTGDVSFGNFKSGPISENDKYLYSAASKNVSVIPTEAKMVTNLQSVNIDSGILEACEVDENEYFRYLSNSWTPYFEPNCLSKNRIDLKLSNHNWELSPKSVDIEDDVFGRASTAKFVIVRGSLKDHFNLANDGYRDDLKEFVNVFVRSNLSLTAEQGDDRTYLFAASFDGKETPNDLRFDVFGFDSVGKNLVPHKQAKVSYDAKRGLYFMNATKDPVALITATNDRYYGVVAMNTDEVSNYDFGYVSGSDSSTRNYAYAYTDRPVYRAGDSVSFKGLLRKFLPTGYAKSSFKNVKVKIVDSDGQTFKEVTLKVDANSNFSGGFDIPKESKTGRFDFEIYASDANGKAQNENFYDQEFIYDDAHFFVEQYSKPVFKVAFPESTKHALPGEKVDIPLEAEYYFGGKLAIVPYSVAIHSQSYYFDAKEFSDYRFGENSNAYECLYWGYCQTSDEFVENLAGKLDGNGRAMIAYQFPELSDANEKLYALSAEVTDPDTGKSVTATSSRVVHVTDGYVGLKTGYWVNKGDPIRSEGAIVDWDAKGLSGKDAKIEFVRVEWKSVKKLGIDGSYYSENEKVETVEKTMTATSDESGRFKAEYLPEKGGEFVVKASYEGRNKKSYVSSDYAYVSDEKASYYWADTNNSVTEMRAEKTILKPGEKASFVLKSPVKSGKVFVTVEKDSGILDAFVRDITSNAERIEIPLESKHIPNVYVKAFLIGKDEGATLPTYKRALSVVKVLPDEKLLTVDVKADRDHKKPGEPLSVAVFVKDASGNPVANANGSLSVVDESVLALMGNPKKNPFAFFYEMKRYLGVRTFASLMNLVDKLEVKQSALGDGAKGGAGEDRKGGDTKKKRGIFKDTAYWKADFVTDANGKAQLKVDKLPDNLTTWEIEALVSTAADNRVGVGRTSVMTSLQVMVNDNLPRVLRTGDRTVLAPVVFNRTGADAEFSVKLSSESLDVKKGETKVRLKNGESKAVEFEVSAKSIPRSETVSYAKISISAKSGDKSDSIEKTVPVTRSETYETVATAGSYSDASFDEKVSLVGVDRDRSTLSVQYGASLFSNASDGLTSLLGYPYGCVEQRTSSIVPHLVVKSLYDSIGAPYDLSKITVKKYENKEVRDVPVSEVLSDYVVSLGSFQYGGGFGYWQGSSFADFRMTAYVLPVLSEIRALKIAVDPSLFKGAADYLKTEFYSNRRPWCTVSSYDDCSYPLSTRLSAVLGVLAADGNDYEAYKMWKLLDAKKYDSKAKIASLKTAAALLKIAKLAPAESTDLKAYVDATIDDVLKKSLTYDSRGAYVVSDGSESRAYMTASLAESLVLLGKDNGPNAAIVENFYRFLAKEKKQDGSYGSTLDTVAVVRSFAARAKVDAAAVTNLVAKGVANGKPFFDTPIDKSQVLKTFSANVPLSGMPDDSVLNFSKVGNGKIYYDISMAYSVPAEKIPARDEGFLVKIENYDLGDFRRIEALKNEEYDRHLANKIRYADLKYPNDTYSYLQQVSGSKVGQLVLVRYRLILPDARDRVAFEAFVPAGAELVNTHLKTESASAKKDTFFEREEFLDDRYFGYAYSLPSGDYEGSFVYRATHAGTYSVPPARAFEFYAPEVFGRSEGKKVEVKAK